MNTANIHGINNFVWCNCFSDIPDQCVYSEAVSLLKMGEKELEEYSLELIEEYKSLKIKLNNLKHIIYNRQLKTNCCIDTKQAYDEATIIIQKGKLLDENLSDKVLNFIGSGVRLINIAFMAMGFICSHDMEPINYYKNLKFLISKTDNNINNFPYMEDPISSLLELLENFSFSKKKRDLELKAEIFLSDILLQYIERFSEGQFFVKLSAKLSAKLSTKGYPFIAYMLNKNGMEDHAVKSTKNMLRKKGYDDSVLKTVIPDYVSIL